MNIIKTSTPSKDQLAALDGLAQSCCAHDQIRLSYPTEDCGDGCRHYLLYTEEGALAAALALIFLDDGFAECSAFTHPDFRRRGFFRCLLHAATEEYEDCDILFAVLESCADTMAVLAALGAEPESREYQMELELEPEGTLENETYPGRPHLHISQAPAPLSGEDATASPTTSWLLYEEEKTAVGQCLITPVSPSCACLHHLEITAALRCQGYGSAFLSLLLPRLAASGFRKIILQVSGDNPAALALYKKTGFRLTETLSYYCY